MNPLHATFHYLKYLTKAQNLHGLHSPFVYALYQNVIATEQQYYFFLNAEKLRENLLLNNSIINKKELGASNKKGFKTTVSKIAKRSLKPSKEAQLLFKLVNYFQSKNILEIGTSLGLTTAYLASANSNAKVITLEGCPETMQVANENVKLLKIENVKCILGNFDDTLPNAISEFSTLDFVFFDGNHTYKSTINYFENCLNNASENTVFVFDDIYWSIGMTKAWQEIKNNIRVTVSVDLFKMGIIFFRPQQAKQHFILRF